MTKRQLMARAAAALGAAVLLIALIPSHKETNPVPPRAEPDLFSFVRSLEGTTPDGRLQSEDDTIVVDADLVRRFDYYLSAIGEKPLDAIRAEIERDIDTRLKGHAAEQAKLFLGRYLDYKQALVEVEKNAQLAGNGIAAMRARMAALRQTRARFFSERESQAVFGMSDASDEDAVARLEISQDGSLSQAQKQEKLAALDAALPPASPSWTARKRPGHHASQATARNGTRFSTTPCRMWIRWRRSNSCGNPCSRRTNSGGCRRMNSSAAPGAAIAALPYAPEDAEAAWRGLLA